MPRPGIEPGTFRSSVWRSPNWAISAGLLRQYINSSAKILETKQWSTYIESSCYDHQNNFFPSIKSYASSWKSTPPSRIWTSDLEISDIGFILQSPALPTELSVVVSEWENECQVIHFSYARFLTFRNMTKSETLVYRRNSSSGKSRLLQSRGTWFDSRVFQFFVGKSFTNSYHRQGD